MIALPGICRNCDQRVFWLSSYPFWLNTANPRPQDPHKQHRCPVGFRRGDHVRLTARGLRTFGDRKQKAWPWTGVVTRDQVNPEAVHLRRDGYADSDASRWASSFWEIDPEHALESRGVDGHL